MDVSPVSVIFQALPEHRHDLVAGHHIVGQIRDVSHLSAGGAPWVIRCRLSHLETKQSKIFQCLGNKRWWQSKGHRCQLATKQHVCVFHVSLHMIFNDNMLKMIHNKYRICHWISKSGILGGARGRQVIDV